MVRSGLRLAPILLLAASVAGAQTPRPFDCQASEVHRQFDSWVGTWTVTDATGQVLGRNEIREVQKGCALEERWTSVRGGTGQSANYYHPGDKEWRQLWVDAGASIIDIRGESCGRSWRISDVDSPTRSAEPGTPRPWVRKHAPCVASTRTGLRAF